jgi:predicted alpha/beta hydrolase
VLIGHSLGGHIATLYALTTTTEAIAGIVTIAADSPYHRAHGACGLLVLATTQLAAGIARLLGYFPGDRLGGVGSQPRTLMVEWARLARSGRYQIREMPGIETQTVDAHLAVLAISIDGDRIAPPPSVDHLTSKLSNVQTKRWHYSCRAAGAERLTHVNWVTRGGGIAERIAAWHHTTAAAHISNPAAMEAVRGRRHAVAALPVDEISARKE